VINKFVTWKTNSNLMPLNIKTNHSLKVKLAVFTAISTALIFLFLVVYIGVSQRFNAYNESKTLAYQISRKASLETENFFSKAFNITRELSATYEVLKNSRVERNILCNILKKAIEDNKDFLGVWLIWEPNIYDGKDKFYANKEHYDSTGNFAITYFRPNGEIKTELNSAIDYQEDYYTIPKNTRQELLIDPYEYQYRGYDKSFYETSVVIPLIYNNIFNGVVAVDIDLSSLQEKLNSIRLYKTGYVSLISSTGVIVSNPDSTFRRKNIYELSPKLYNKINPNNLFTGQEKSYETTSEFTGKRVLRLIYPIRIGNTNTPWYTLVEIPLSEITFRSNQLLFTSILILLIGISLLIYLTINILERRKYEKVLIDAKHKAEESEKIKSAFLSNISHEIRTPMNGIIGFTELISDKNIDDIQRKTYKEQIQNSCNQLLFTINDVLDISVIEAGEVSIKKSTVSLSEVLINLQHFFEPLAKDKKIKLSHTVDYNDINIETDELKLVQILNNLISNGIKFTEEGSVEFGFNKMNDYLQFFVKDTGIGIKPENRSLVFERFMQEDNSMNRKYKGTGLGLPISKAFAEMLGGKIWFENNNPRGTIFYFTLPY